MHKKWIKKIARWLEENQISAFENSTAAETRKKITHTVRLSRKNNASRRKKMQN